jgi:hypothetical protein
VKHQNFQGFLEDVKNIPTDLSEESVSVHYPDEISNRQFIAAEINTRVHYVDYSGGKAREQSEPKWKLIIKKTAFSTSM